MQRLAGGHVGDTILTSQSLNRSVLQSQINMSHQLNLIYILLTRNCITALTDILEMREQTCNEFHNCLKVAD